VKGAGVGGCGVCKTSAKRPGEREGRVFRGEPEPLEVFEEGW